MKRKKQTDLKTKIEETRFDLNMAYKALAISDNPILTESLIYEIKSLEKKHEYLINEIKREESIK